MDGIKQWQEILVFEMEQIVYAGYQLDSVIYIMNKEKPLSISRISGSITKENILYEVNHFHK